MNQVYVFAKAQPSPIAFLAEVRSMVEKGGKSVSTMQVKLLHRNPSKTVSILATKSNKLSLIQRPPFNSAWKRYPCQSSLHP